MWCLPFSFLLLANVWLLFLASLTRSLSVAAWELEAHFRRSLWAFIFIITILYFQTQNKAQKCIGCCTRGRCWGWDLLSETKQRWEGGHMQWDQKRNFSKAQSGEERRKAAVIDNWLCMWKIPNIHKQKLMQIVNTMKEIKQYKNKANTCCLWIQTSIVATKQLVESIYYYSK